MAVTIKSLKSFGLLGCVVSSLLLAGCGSRSSELTDMPTAPVDNIVDTRQVAEDRRNCHHRATSDAASKGGATGALIGNTMGARRGNAGAGVLVGAVLGMMAGAAIEEQEKREAREQAAAEAQCDVREIAKDASDLATR